MSDAARPSGAAALVAALEDLGVRLAFGLPGVHNLPLWDAVATSRVRLAGVRHEQTAVYAADGLARTTGALGVALTTTGPGAANAVAATGEAHASGSPVLVVATDIATTLRRPGIVRGALHETSDQAAMFAPVTKAIRRAAPGDDLGALVREAAATALTPPTGPVYVEIPTDLLPSKGSDLVCEQGSDLACEQGSDPAAVQGSDPAAALRDAVARAAALLVAAERPLIWAGTGAVHAGAGAAVQALAERLGAPVFETYGARGLIAPGHPCRIGLPPHLPEAGALWDEADVVVAIGSDLDGMTTQNWRQPAPPHLVAVNVDARDAAKSYAAEVVVEADARVGAEALVAALDEASRPGPHGIAGGAAGGAGRGDLGVAGGAKGGAGRGDLGAVGARLDALRAAARGRLAASDPEPTAFLAALAVGLDDDVAVFADMCIPGYWTAALHDFARPRRLAYPVGWGTLGFAFPASLGAALAGERTLALCGDGGFLFACGELATAQQERAPLTVLLVDDGGYGMLRFDQRHAGRPAFGVDLHTPDWVALAHAFGIAAERVTDLAADLRRHLAEPEPSLLVHALALRPPETTSPRWYRKAPAA